MKRKIPENLNSMVLYPLMGEGERTEKRFLNLIDKHERRLEKSLIETLSRIEISATTKTDRFSLPYKNEVAYRAGGESYLNGAYEFFRVARVVVKELLDKGVYKVRFYILIEIDTEKNMRFGEITYRIRYHIPHT